MIDDDLHAARYIQKTNTFIFKGAVVSQIDSQNQAKAGFELALPEVEFGTPVHLVYINNELTRKVDEEGYPGPIKRYPVMGAAYIQDQLDRGDLIVRFGGRIDYFDARSYVPGDLANPANAYDTVPVYDLKDPSKILTMAVVKNDGVAMKHGKWLYYDPREGTVEASEVYVMNKLQTDDGSMFNDDEIRPISISQGKQKSDTAAVKTSQKPQVILDYEKKNSGKKKIKVRDGSTGNLPKP